MKFNYSADAEYDSDNEFLENTISTSFTFDVSERQQLKHMKKWLKSLEVRYAVTVTRDEEGKKKYCLVVYEEEEEEEEFEYEEVENSKKSKKSSKKKKDDTVSN